jgi:hypothetical protein
VLEGDAANTSFIAFGLIHDLPASEASMLIILIKVHLFINNEKTHIFYYKKCCLIVQNICTNTGCKEKNVHFHFNNKPF